MKKNYLSKVVSIMLAGTLFLSATACTAKAPVTPPTAEATKEATKDAPADAPKAEEVKVFEKANLVLWGSQEDQTFLNDTIKKFNAKPEFKDIAVEVRVQGEDKSREAVQSDPDAAADVFGIPHDQLGDLVRSGLVYENTKYAAELKSNTIEPAINAAMYDGKMYGYPNSAETYFMYYNKSIITPDDAKSLEKMLTAATAKKAKVGQDIMNGYFAIGYYFTAGSNLFGEDGKDATNVTFNNAGGLAATKYIGQLKDKGLLGISGGEAASLLQSGELAAMVSGSWDSNAYKAALGENFGVAKLPTVNIDGTEKDLMSFSGMKLYLVKASTKFPTQAMALANFMCSEEVQKDKFLARSAFPANKNLSTWDAIANDDISKAQLEQLAFSRPMPSTPNMSMFWTLMGPLLTDVYKGIIVPADYQVKLDELCKNIIEAK